MAPLVSLSIKTNRLTTFPHRGSELQVTKTTRSSRRSFAQAGAPPKINVPHFPTQQS